jgi:hypothetical protein
MPPDIESAIRSTLKDFREFPVAVRSSATAEDLPDLSFAGQQDTYLNVIGEEEILKAVVNCWSSLWTARAIGYRIHNHIPQDEVALAVIVQEMVQSEVSGVMFTANPLTGLRNETVIDATFGLGEALVSGQVEPDHYVVDIYTNAIVSKTLGAKEQATRARSGGGVEMTRDLLASMHQALTDSQILQLAGQGRSIQREYGFPQDVEWAFADGNCYILQSRAGGNIRSTAGLVFLRRGAGTGRTDHAYRAGWHPACLCRRCEIVRCEACARRCPLLSDGRRACLGQHYRSDPPSAGQACRPGAARVHRARHVPDPQVDNGGSAPGSRYWKV